jgi:hypothetical protein
MVTLHLSQDPPPELDHGYNDDQTITLTRLPLQVMAELIGVPLDPMPPPFEITGRGGSVALQAALAALRGALADQHPVNDFERYRLKNANDMAEYLSLMIEHESGVLAQERDETARLIGRDIADEGERNAALERYVEGSGPDRDAALVKFFFNRAARREALLGPKPKLFPKRQPQKVW